jgi:hypothetical protein
LDLLTVFQGKLLSERTVAMDFIGELFKEIFTTWWLTLLFVLLLVLIGVFFYVRKAGQDDDDD